MRDSQNVLFKIHFPTLLDTFNVSPSLGLHQPALAQVTSTRTKMADNVLPADRGDFVDSDKEIDVEIESEDPYQYLTRFYYPVLIGELLTQRYQVVHKLGRGGFSTVWLADDRSNGTDVALKVLSSSALGSTTKEYGIHKDVVQRVQDRSRLVLCQDHVLLQQG